MDCKLYYNGLECKPIICAPINIVIIKLSRVLQVCCKNSIAYDFWKENDIRKL